MTGWDDERKKTILASIFLVFITLFSYLRVWNYPFLIFDDYRYVVDNAHVSAGLTLEGIRWAFTTVHEANWHPLTWLSHMLDCQLFGLNPGPHHVVNIIIHGISVLLLFLVLHRMTKAFWQSAFVAVVFAIHPLHVESVAWIAERKDVLSGLFWMLTLGAYVRYVERPVIKRYIPVLGFFALGLLTKPMLVTLPCVLLLLDYWPLRRIRFGILETRSDKAAVVSGNIKKNKKEKLRATTKPATANIPGVVSFPLVSVRFLIQEKIPLILISLISCAVTIYAQDRGGALQNLKLYPLTERIANALVSYVLYLGKTFWPFDLGVFYPYPASLSMVYVLFSALLLCSITAFVIVASKRFPYLIVGWLWYLGTLVPVIGLIQVGGQSMADRYTYLPLIGICLMIGWGMTDLPKGRPFQKNILTVSAMVILVMLSVVSWRQLDYWHDNISLFRHTIAVTKNNAMASACLGKSLLNEGKVEEAIVHFKEVIRIDPAFLDAHIKLGNALMAQGKIEEAVAHFEEAIRINPAYVDAHINLANALTAQGKSQEAMRHLTKALTLRPDDPEVHYNVGIFLAGQRDIPRAIDQFREAIRLRPGYAKAHNNLGSALLLQGKIADAVTQFEEALRIDPGYKMARTNLQDALTYLRGSQKKNGSNGQP